MATGNPLGVRVVVHDETVLAQLRAGRRELNQAVKRGLLQGAEEIAVPAVRAVAPHRSGRLEASIIARATTKGVYLTSSITGKAGRYVGLLNYGGTVSVVITTRRARAAAAAATTGRRRGPAGTARALKMPDGRFVSRVATPRVYPRRLFFERGRDAALPGIEEILATHVVDELAGAVLEVVR